LVEILERSKDNGQVLFAQEWLESTFAGSTLLGFYELG
jgi:hypothetical protein